MLRKGNNSACVFFECVVAKQCWAIISDILNCRVGENMVEIGKFWLSNKKHVPVNMIRVKYTTDP